MTTEEWIQFGSLLTAILAFAGAQFWTLNNRKQRDDRSNTKLKIFQILGNESKTLEKIKEGYSGKITDSELEKAIYEMLVDGTAFYERTNTFRARWRNPKSQRN
jgi:hypothetical protein